MNKPLFSIVIPTLNEEHYLPKLLLSLKEQTFRDFEVIVVDGLSKDATVNMAKKEGKKLPGFQLITDRASLPYQRNLGAKKTHGEWLLFIDADSILMPYSLERMAAFIREQRPAVFTTWCLPDSAIPKEAIIAILANLLYESSLIFKRPMTPGPFTAIRRELFTQVGGYDETHAYNEDVDLGLRLAKAGYQVSLIRETLYVYSLRRIRKENKLKLLQQYLVSVLPVLFFNTSLKSMPGYVMGGQLYNKTKRPIPREALKRYELKIKEIVREVFG